MLGITHLDHLVLTVRDIEATVIFYTNVLGMEHITFQDKMMQTRHALKFGQQKMNLHESGKEFEPKAVHPTPGSADLCFISKTPIKDVISHVQSCNIEIEEGPVHRTGANGPILSIYIRDPDNNLMEIANYLEPT